jgi:hypothetical protein
VRGHLEARGRRVWRAKVYLGRGDDGTKRYVTRTIRGTKREAEEALAELVVGSPRARRRLDDTERVFTLGRRVGRASSSGAWRPPQWTRSIQADLIMISLS